MGLTTVGTQAIASLVLGDAVVADYSTSNAYIGIGDGGATAFAVGQTDNQGSNKTRVAVTSASRVTDTITYGCTFGTSEGNHGVSEVALFNDSSAGQMMSRKVVALGTKTSGEVWVINLAVQFTT